MCTIVRLSHPLPVPRCLAPAILLFSRLDKVWRHFGTLTSESGLATLSILDTLIDNYSKWQKCISSKGISRHKPNYLCWYVQRGCYIKCKRNLFIVFNNTLFISCVDILSFNIQNDNIKYAAATSLHGRLLVHVVTGTLGADDVLSVLGL